MIRSARVFFTVLFFSILPGFFSQEMPQALKPDPELEKMFFPYLATRHGGSATTLQWKESNTVLYYQELWYFCKSFSVKRNHLAKGSILPESIIDISRFESLRKKSEETIVIIPGFKDALVLLPAENLVHLPQYIIQQ
jgi:hypothetical protein